MTAFFNFYCIFALILALCYQWTFEASHCHDSHIYCLTDVAVNTVSNGSKAVQDILREGHILSSVATINMSAQPYGLL